MNKMLLSACLMIAVLSGCKTKPKEETIEEIQRREILTDSLTKVIKKESYDRVFGDTSGLSSSPIKVTAYRIVKSDGGTYRNVQLTFKNVSNKKVSAIRFAWKGVDAFGEPADLGNSFAEGFGGGFTDNELRPGISNTSEWSVLSRNAKKLTGAWVTEAVYEDGSKWKLNN